MTDINSEDYAATREAIAATVRAAASYAATEPRVERIVTYMASMLKARNVADVDSYRLTVHRPYNVNQSARVIVASPTGAIHAGYSITTR
jgi:hypothetical protein